MLKSIRKTVLNAIQTLRKFYREAVPETRNFYRSKVLKKAERGLLLITLLIGITKFEAARGLLECSCPM